MNVFMRKYCGNRSTFGNHSGTISWNILLILIFERSISKTPIEKNLLRFHGVTIVNKPATWPTEMSDQNEFLVIKGLFHC